MKSNNYDYKKYNEKEIRLCNYRNEIIKILPAPSSIAQDSIILRVL